MTQPLHHPSPTAATPMAYALHMVEMLRAHGLAWRDLLDQVQIPPDELNQPNARITAGQMESLSALTMARLNDEALGWFERPLPWGSYGLLARASITAPTLAVALQRWCRHHGLLTNAVGLRLDADHPSGAVVQLHTPGVHAAQQEFCSVTLLRNVLGFASWVVDSRIALRSVALAFAAPPHADAYTVLFPCPVVFDAPLTQMTLDAHYLQLTPCRSEDDTRAMLQRALPLTVRHYRRDRLLVQQVRQLLRQSPRDMGDAESLAHALSMSVRSLHRQLAAEGAQLQHIKTEVRMRLAQQLLVRSDKPLKHIAHTVGFGDDKSFIRAFKNWAGQTPQRFRDQRATDVAN
jgi:AraC-like DNA-binding protein